MGTSGPEIGSDDLNNGLPVQILGVAAQPELAGLDPSNLLIPRELAGRGEVEIRITVDGVDASVVTVVIA